MQAKEGREGIGAHEIWEKWGQEEKTTDMDSKSHFQIAGGFLHWKERRPSLPHYRKNKEQEKYYGH